MQTSADGSVVVGTLVSDADVNTAFVVTRRTRAGDDEVAARAAVADTEPFRAQRVDGSIVLALATNAVAPPIILDGVPSPGAPRTQLLPIPAPVEAFDLLLMTPDASLVIVLMTPSRCRLA